jgi:hypothetical protein
MGWGGFDFDPGCPMDGARLQDAAVLSLGYGTAFLAGVLATQRAGVLRRCGDLCRRKIQAAALPLLLLIPLGSIHALALLGILRLQGVPSTVTLLMQCAYLASLATVCARAAQRPSAGRLLLAFLAAAAALAIGASTAMRENLVLPAIACAAGLSLGTRRPRLVLVILIALGAISFGAISRWNRANRITLWDERREFSPAERIETAIGSITSPQPEEDTRDDPIAVRFVTAIPMMQTMKLTEDEYGVSIVEGFFLPLVPRVAWPQKPPVTIGDELYYRFTGNQGSSSSPGQPAEAQMYGGPPAVAAIGFLLGVLAEFMACAIHAAWFCRSASFIGLAIPVAIPFLKCENWLFGYFASLPSALAIMAALVAVGSIFARRSPVAVLATHSTLAPEARCAARATIPGPSCS